MVSEYVYQRYADLLGFLVSAVPSILYSPSLRQTPAETEATTTATEAKDCAPPADTTTEAAEAAAIAGAAPGPVIPAELPAAADSAKAVSSFPYFFPLSYFAGGVV